MGSTKSPTASSDNATNTLSTLNLTSENNLKTNGNSSLINRHGQIHRAPRSSHFDFLLKKFTLNKTKMQKKKNGYSSSPLLKMNPSAKLSNNSLTLDNNNSRNGRHASSKSEANGDITNSSEHHHSQMYEPFYRSFFNNNNTNNNNITDLGNTNKIELIN